ncbi:hypothetical protein EOD39_5613 [Acipenser ruthenus]|uniref:Endonuclease/exonuclease/phosphatase domain-containing protein n=1 Tax=Acipenser ruthenus TaxID=7906 RepID=A0A444UDL7_ACIRT|nr:hypothetical protein EOD39_5613 [Acipenser ruthenus]
MIACISETKLTTRGVELSFSNAMASQMPLSKHPCRRWEGSKQDDPSVIAFQPFSNRLAILTIDGTVMTHIVSIYAPTDVSPDDMKDDFYTQLQDALGTIPGRDLVILASDFNAHVGTDRAGWEGTLGRFGVGTNNDNGLHGHGCLGLFSDQLPLSIIAKGRPCNEGT